MSEKTGTHAPSGRRKFRLADILNETFSHRFRVLLESGGTKPESFRSAENGLFRQAVRMSALPGILEEFGARYFLSHSEALLDGLSEPQKHHVREFVETYGERRTAIESFLARFDSLGEEGFIRALLLRPDFSLR